MVIDKYLRYGMRDTMRSLWRHKGMVLVSVFTVATMLLVLGATTLLALNSEHAAAVMEDQLEIVVFLKSDLERETALALESKLQDITGFKQATFIPKEDALETMGDKFESTTSLSDALGGTNPLPDAYSIKLEQPEQIPTAVSYLEGLEEVELVRYGQDVVENMISLSGVLEVACIAVIIGMVIVALFLVNSTIRLTVSARSEEINIMKYVGATNFYVRVPFFLEGLVIGIVGAIIANIALYFGYHAVVDYMTTSVSFVPMLDDNSILVRIMLILLISGTALGAIGSNFAVRKYLKV